MNNLLLPILLLLFLVTQAIFAGRTSCQQVCAHSIFRSSDAEDEASFCNCCYEKLVDMETLTARDWWRNTRAVDQDRHAWFRNRLVHNPIVGEDTIVAGVLYTFSARTLKMTIMFPPLYPTESRTATLMVTGQSSGTSRVANCIIKEHTWNCLARMDNLSHNEAYAFEVMYHPDPNDNNNNNNNNLVYTYDGFIPQQVGYPRIAAMGCFGKDNTKDKSELVRAVASESADILVRVNCIVCMSR